MNLVNVLSNTQLPQVRSLEKSGGYDEAATSTVQESEECSASPEILSPKSHNQLLPELDNVNVSQTSFLDHRYFKWIGSNQFWPYVYLVLWFIFNIVLTLYCKILFSFYKFPYPMLMTIIHMLFTTLGVFLCQWLGLYSPKSVAPQMRLTVLWFSFVFTLNIWLSNASLLAVSVNLHQVVRVAIPLFTMGISLFFFGDRYPCTLLPPVLLIMFGVALTLWNDLDFTSSGLFVVFLGCFFSSLKGIITQKMQVGSLGLFSLDLLRYLCPLAIIQLVVLASSMGEVSRFVAYSNIRSPLIIHLSLLGLIAFKLNFVSFRCGALLNPLTMNIAGNVKQVCTCLLSLTLFGEILSIALLLGIFGTAVGAFWYSQEMRKWQACQKTLARCEDVNLLPMNERSLNNGEKSSFVEIREEIMQQRNRLTNERKAGIIEV